ncbi:MAG: hypothetical protein GOVbin1709_90 [Prokaryotic dsDNA virus sp.]|nr:MAG: hypothetical protein GOVbin1709_90 [Prokaryotic dsDNA virus sp.]|tara:strand:+ start:1798 stop:2397 length:600 start_codon:yes stop_codon:yes gene_type:complete
MSKYKNPYGGNGGKKTTNLFYRSGISSLISRIEKIEHEVFCCKDAEDIFSIDGTATLVRETHNYGTILWAAEADAETLTLYAPQKGDKLDIILSADTHGSGVSITTAVLNSASHYFYGTVFVTQSDADDTIAMQTKSAAESLSDVNDHLNLEDDNTATGGQRGNKISLIATADNVWHVSAILSTTGTPSSIATMAAAAV